MKIRRVIVKNFRGIKECDWRLSGGFLALVGPQDSTKTTLLDAIGLALSSRYNLVFTDADFHGGVTDDPIVIEVAVTDLPTHLIRQDTHGHDRCGIDEFGELHHEPMIENGIDECFLVRLTVPDTLEPFWELVKPGAASGETINGSQRAQLGFFRVGDYVDQHLRWGRNSALTNLTNSSAGVTDAVVEAQRRAREAVFSLSGTPLHIAAEIARAHAARLGSSAFTNLRPGLDPTAGAGSTALLLHEGDVPLTQFGLGSRRLLSLAVQENALPGQSMIAIDEVENGLDPHRVSHLVRHLRERAAQGQLQVLFTTHSPLVVESLSYDQLFVVRNESGVTKVSPVPSTLQPDQVDVLQGVMRDSPSALLARRVLVGEGATEVGFARELFHQWDAERPGADQVIAATAGLAISNGRGDSVAPVRARALAELGYPAMLLIDGDVTTNAQVIADAASAGVEVMQWSVGRALEDVIATELPVEGLQEMVDLATDERSEESVRDAVSAHLGQRLDGVEVQAWIATHGEDPTRMAIARAAKGARLDGEKDTKRSWFKREDRGEQLGAIVRKYAAEIPADGELATQIPRLKRFVYGQPEAREDAAPSAN